MRKCGHDPRITLILYFTNIYVRLLCAWDFCKPGFLTHRVSLTALWGTCCYYPRLTGKETDTRSQVPAQEHSDSWCGGWDFNPAIWFQSLSF